MAAVNAGGGQGPAAALAAAGAACQCLTSHGGEEGLSPAVRMWFMAISVFLVLFAGLMVRGGVEPAGRAAAAAAAAECLPSYRVPMPCHYSVLQAGLTLGLLSLDR